MVNSSKSGSSSPPTISGTISAGKGPTDHTTSGGGSSPYPIKTTRPNELLRHDISNEQLDMLVEGNRDWLSGAFFTFTGTTLGSFSSAFTNVKNSFFGSDTVPLSLGGLLEIIIFSVSFFFALGCLFAFRRKKKAVDKLVEEIRGRTKQ